MDPAASDSSRSPDPAKPGTPPESSFQGESSNQDDRHPQPTLAHTPGRPDSRGLQIRCPHCSNGVELLADTPYEEITCSTCGSRFNLVEREDLSQAATALKTMGRFELVSRLGVGGFGTVWKARDTDLDRIVAVKIPRSGQLGAAEVEQFFREARAAAQLRHPNIVSVHEVGRDGDTIFIVSDLIRGVTLSDWLSGTQPTQTETVDLIRTIALALHHAHQQGVVHRDLKPSNVMIDEQGQPHLMDFGLAKREVGEITMTVDGQVMGTPAFMSPEQAGGHAHRVDRRSDLYSLGVMLHQLLTGELPFRGNAQMQVHQRLTEDAPDPRKLNDHIHRDLATICLKCLEREPNKRYSTGQAVADELDRFGQGRPIVARPLSRVARLGRWAKRNPLKATTAGLTLFLAIAGPMVAWRIDSQRRRLAALVTEKNGLIGQNALEKQQDVAEISRLSRQLDRWAGRANPWHLWPPEPMTSPRRMVLGKLFDQQYQALRRKFDSGTYNDRQQAAGQIGLARMTDKLGHPKQAHAHYLAARDLLDPLSRKYPEEIRYREALADCHAQLARLDGTQDKENAGAALWEASRLYGQLASQHESQPRYPIARIETELQRSVLVGFEEAGEHLNRATALEQMLQRQWPTEPVALYEMVAYLTQQEPLLSAKSESGNPDDAKSDGAQGD